MFVEAVRRLDQILQDPQMPRALRDQAQSERGIATRNIATLVVDPGTSQGATILLDGHRVQGDPPRSPANPGPHTLRVELPGQPPIDRAIHLVPGETLRITLDRTRELVIVPGPTTPNPIVAPRGLHPAWFWTAAGATGIAGALTLWSGLDTLSAHSAYETDLPTLTQPQIDARVANGHDLERRTNILLGTTAVLAVGTAALGVFYTRWGSAAVRPTVGGLQVAASF